MAYRSPAPASARFDERKRVFWARHSRYARLVRWAPLISYVCVFSMALLFSDSPHWLRWYMGVPLVAVLPAAAASVLRPSRCPDCDRRIDIDGMHAGTRYGACWFCSYSSEEAETDIYRELSRKF